MAVIDKSKAFGGRLPQEIRSDDCPCKGCVVKRAALGPGCHAICPDYKAWRADLDNKKHDYKGVMRARDSYTAAHIRQVTKTIKEGKKTPR